MSRCESYVKVCGVRIRCVLDSERTRPGHGPTHMAELPGFARARVFLEWRRWRAPRRWLRAPRPPWTRSIDAGWDKRRRRTLARTLRP